MGRSDRVCDPDIVCVNLFLLPPTRLSLPLLPPIIVCTRAPHEAETGAKDDT
jgi:hypothetical protein